MAVERKDSAAVRKDMSHDDDTFIGTPSARLGIGYLAVPDAVHRCAKTRPPGQDPVIPVVILGASSAKTVYQQRIVCVGWIHWKVEQVNHTTWRTALR